MHSFEWTQRSPALCHCLLHCLHMSFVIKFVVESKVRDAVKATRSFANKQTESRHLCGWNRIKLHPKPHPTKEILYWFVGEKFMIKPSVNWKQWRNQCNEQSSSEATDWQWEYIKDSFQRKDGNYWNFTGFRDIVVLSLSWWGPGSPVLDASLCLQPVGKT